MDFNLSRMLVVDFMHEVELGIWKTLFTHLICILYAMAPGGKLVGILDERFRNTPLFSQAICRFTNNVSEMKKLTARDHEDLLQVISFLFTLVLSEKLTIVAQAFLSVPSQHLKVFLMSLITNVL